ADRLGRLRADTQPVLSPLGVELDVARVLLRVVLADRLDRTAVPPGAGVGDHDAVVRFADLADPRKLDLHSHGWWCSSALVRASASMPLRVGKTDGTLVDLPTAGGERDPLAANNFPLCQTAPDTSARCPS